MVLTRALGAVRLGAVAAAVVISGGLTALPALAAGTVPSGSSAQFAAFVSSPEVTLLPKSAGAQAQAFHSVGLVVFPETENGLTGVEVAVDASSLAGVAELSLPKNCSFTDAARLHARCPLGSVSALGDGGQVAVGLRATAAAAVGAKGTVSFKVTAPGATEDPQDAPTAAAITVGDGPDVAVGLLAQTLDVTAGQATPVNPTVGNVGDRDAQGVTLFLSSLGEGFALGDGDHSNCTYGVDLGIIPGLPKTGVVCHFDTVVKPGETYQLSDPALISAVTTGGDPAGVQGGLMYGWDTRGGLIESGFSGGKAGAGAPLTLTKAPVSQAARPHVVDINYDNNLGVSTLHLLTQDDVAAVAHDLRGTVGQKLTATFGVRNVGKAATRPVADGSDVTAGLLMALPKGVTVVSAPAGCSQDPKGSPEAARLSSRARTTVRAVAGREIDPSTAYFCVVRHVLQPGQEADFAFTVKPVKALHAQQGLVAVLGQPDDNNVENNVVQFSVTATDASGTGTPAPKPSVSASHAPSASASATPGGGLAHTGGGSDALPLAAAGAAAIAVGAGTVVLTRRRRRSGAGSHS